MDYPEGAGSQRANRVDFEDRVRLEFRGAQISSDGGLDEHAEFGVVVAGVEEHDAHLGIESLADVGVRVGGEVGLPGGNLR